MWICFFTWVCAFNPLYVWGKKKTGLRQSRHFILPRKQTRNSTQLGLSFYRSISSYDLPIFILFLLFILPLPSDVQYSMSVLSCCVFCFPTSSFPLSIPLPFRCKGQFFFFCFFSCFFYFILSAFCRFHLYLDFMICLFCLSCYFICFCILFFSCSFLFFIFYPFFVPYLYHNQSFLFFFIFILLLLFLILPPSVLTLLLFLFLLHHSPCPLSFLSLFLYFILPFHSFRRLFSYILLSSLLISSYSLFSCRLLLLFTPLLSSLPLLSTPPSCGRSIQIIRAALR